ncbi:helix-turn-helix domain-containing protein [Candidatus Uhrbacteria bacterium]|nr:helix-turn-helix domain-containing protein [Candidatus Uhrbacteria bacterium]MBD3284032.1 helix-turn-helix domain-containing protein [Candidatus Uhrbacteria bacterium]
MKNAQIPLRITVSEASRLFGVHDRTIRRAIRSSEIRYVVVHGRYKLNFDSLMIWSQRKTSIRHKRDSKGIGQWVDQWKIKNTLYSPRPPRS